MSTNKLRLEQSRHLYGILEIPNFSSIEEVRVAYKTLALRYHPDKNLDDPHASERFKEVCAVYELLVNEATKKRYDTALRMFHICTGAPSSSNSTTASTTTAAWSRRGVHKDEGDVDGVTKKRSASHRDSDATLPTAAGSRSSSYANFAEAAYSSSSTTTHRPGHSGFAASSPSTRSGSDRAAAASHYTEEQKQDFRRRESERIARLCKHMQEMKMAKREHERVAQQRALDRRAHWDEQRRAVHQRAFSANQPSQRTSSARSNGHGTRGGEAAPTAIPVDHTSNGTSGTASHGISDDVNYTNSSNRTSSSNHNRSSDRHSSYSNACRAPVGQHSEEEATAFSGGGHIGDSVHSLRESFATHGANGAVPPTSPSHLQDLHRAHADNTSFTTTGTTPVTDAASSRHPPLPVRTRSRVSSSRSSSTYLCAAGAKEGHGLGETPASTMTPHGVTQACRSVGGRGELVRDARAMAAPDRCTTPRRHQQDTPRHPPPRRKLGAGDNTITTASIEDDHHYNSNNIHEHEETDWSIGHTLTQTDVHAEKDCKVHAIDTRTGSACKDSINGGTSDLTAAAGAVSVASSRHAGGSVSIMRGRDVHRTAAARKEQSANAAPLPPQRVTRTVSVHRTPCATATRGVKNTSANTIIMTTTPVMTNSNNNSKDCHSSDDDRGGDESVQHEQEQEQKTRSRNAGAGVWKAVHEETAARVRLTQLQHREWTRLMVERVHGTTLMLGSSNNSSHIKQCVPSEKENVSDDACEKDVRWPVRTASPTSVSSVIHTNNVSSLSLPTLAVKQLAETRLCVDNGLRCDQKHTNGGATMVQRVRVVSSLAQLTQKELLDRAAIEQCHEDDTTELIRWHARVRHHRYAVEKAAAVRLTQSRYHYEMTAMRAQIVHLKEIIARMSENTSNDRNEARKVMGSKLTREQVLDYREMVKDRLSEESISFLYDKFLTAAPSGSMDLLSFARYIDSTGSYKCRQIQKMKDNNKRMSLALRVRYLFFTYDNSKSSTGDMSADADSPDYTSVNDDLYVHLFRGFDLDGNGIITFKEFLLYHLAVIYNTEELFYIVFNTYDQDGDGYLSLQDIRATITISTRYVGDVDINHCAAQRVIEEEANRLFGFLDIRKDGYIQKEDMRRIVQKYPQVLEKMKYLM